MENEYIIGEDADELNKPPTSPTEESKASAESNPPAPAKEVTNPVEAPAPATDTNPQAE